MVDAKAFTPSTTFARRLADLGFVTYREYVKSDSWIARREAWYERNGRWCRICKCPAPSMVLHHKSYVNLGAEPDGDLIALCSDCHSDVHRHAAALHLGLGQAVRHVQRLRRMDGY